MDVPKAPVERSLRWQSLVVALAALVSNAPALRNGFVLDDNLLLVENPYVRTFAGLRELVVHELFVASAEPRLVPYYRPASGFLNWLSFQLLGASAPLQHALNLLLHAAVTLLLLRAAVAYRARPSVAFGGALLFAVHPASAEVVAYIGGRQDMLGWCVGLSAILFARRASTPLRALALAWGASLFGALCHELFIGLFVPLALLLLYEDGARSRRRALAAFVGGGLAVASLLALRHALGLLPFEANLDGPSRIARAAVGVALRLFKDVALPTDLAVDVSVPLPSLAAAILLFVLAEVATFFLARAVARRRRELQGPLLAGLSIVGVSALLHAGVVLKYGIASDRYAYAALLGVVFAGVACFETWLPTHEPASPLVAAARRWSVPALALAFLPLTWARVTSWYDQRSLQLAMVADRPDDPESWLAEGMLAFGEGDVERAYPRCRAYADARPDSDKANLCVGSWLLLHGRAQESVTYLRPYALARPGVATARRTFLFALLSTQRYDELRSTLSDWSQSFAGAPELVEAEAALRAARPPAP